MSEQQQQGPPTAEEIEALYGAHAEKLREDFGHLGGVGVSHTVYDVGFIPLVHLHIDGHPDSFAFTVAGALKLAADITRHAYDAENEAAIPLLFQFHRGDPNGARALLANMIAMRDTQREIEAKAGGSALDEHIARAAGKGEPPPAEGSPCPICEGTLVAGCAVCDGTGKLRS